MRLHASAGNGGGFTRRPPSLPIPSAYLTRVRVDEPMAAHCSWHAGGKAEVLFSPHDAEDLAGFLRELPRSVPVYWIGLGTNVLVREGGYRGVVIATPGAFTRIERRAHSTVYCEASVPCARIARSCANWGLSQAEFFSGIPGSLGGALAMNAGAFGDETWRHVLSVETIDRDGRRRQRGPQDYQVGYREVALAGAGASEAGASEAGASEAGEWFLSAELQFDPQPAVGGATAALMQRRRETQPQGVWSCGSVFKNPPGDHAARLIESAGLKGARIGDALVSDKHANFIVNAGQATARDLERLVLHVQATVRERFGITLQPEVRIIGEEST
jgi:UDP-N-acetylmuramate dehydrogenase